MRFTITSEHAKMRLDKFLKEHFSDLSRVHLQTLVKDGQVAVNGEKVTPHHFLKEGDEVEAWVQVPEGLHMIPNPAVQFEVLHEDPDFIMVNKPAGLVVHQGGRHKEPDTLANGLLAKYPESGKVGDDPVRPGIVHRLDADVSGVMVVALNQDMFDHLKRQLKMHEVEKEYVAVVAGKISPPEGAIEFAVARKGAKMVARPKSAEGKMAVTDYTLLSSDGKFSVLKVQTRTGRTHQIRVHLQAKGWPIVGDRLYGKRHIAYSKPPEPLAIGHKPSAGAPRLMLHARRIAFKDLTGKKREFIVEPPFSL